MLTPIDLREPDAGAALCRALFSDSCALIEGHGIGDHLRARMVGVTRGFFALPPERKAAVQWDGDGPWWGWQPVYQGLPEITGARVPDLVERFEAQELATFDHWPTEPAGFAATWTAYYTACTGLATQILRLLAAELELPEADLAAWTDRQFANLVANHYPAQTTAPEPGQARTGIHTDRGGLTLLWADEAPGGLEILPPGATDWVPVQIPAGAFLLQVGDMLAHWVDQRIRPNLHRVVNPPAALAATASRLALVFFHYPALDTQIVPVAADAEAGGAPLDAGAHFFVRQEGFKTRADSVNVGGY